MSPGSGGYVTGNEIDVVIAGIVFFIFLDVRGASPYALALALHGRAPHVTSRSSAVSTNIVRRSALIGLSVSPTVALFCLIFCILYQQFDSYFTQARGSWHAR